MINKQNRSKVFLAVIGILLVANIAQVSFFLLKKDDDKREKRPDKKAMISAFLKNEIGFDTLQLKQFDTLSDRHRANMKKMMDTLRIPKDKQFKVLAENNFNDSVIIITAEQSAVSQKVMELQNFNHLKNIRLLCTSQQLPKFDSLFGNMLNRRNNDVRKKDAEKN